MTDLNFLKKTKLGLSQPLHDCNDTDLADHVPETHILGNNLGKMPKYHQSWTVVKDDISQFVDP